MKKLGFTLAEVLITLVIIGVIAAMTVPSLMQNTGAQEYRSGLKKAISGLNQALQLNYALEGLVPADYTTKEALVDELFRQRMNVLTTPESTKWTEIPGATGTGSNRSTGGASCLGNESATWTTQDGIKFCINDFTFEDSDTGACNIYNTKPCTENGGNIYIDVNGDRKPNQMTTGDGTRPKDIYRATLYSQKVVPYGTATQAVMFDRQSQGSSTAGGA